MEGYFEMLFFVSGRYRYCGLAARIKCHRAMRFADDKAKSLSVNRPVEAGEVIWVLG